MRAAALSRPERALARGRALAERHAALVAFTSGAAAALAFAPFHLWPLLLAFAVLLYLLRQDQRPRRAFVLGFWFGFGHFALGLYWVAIAFFSDAERFGVLAIPAVLALCAGMALYPGLACWLTALRRWRSASAHALALGLAWTGAELLRSELFGGFPWNLIGYSWVGTPVSQLAAVTGVFGLSLVSVTLGALPAALLENASGRRWPAALAAAAVLAALWAGGAYRLASTEVASVPDVRLRLVQGNVAQHHKWQPELRARWFRRHLDLSTGPGAATHIIWPESATPFAIEREPAVRAEIARVAPPDGYVITGGERFDLDSDPPRAWNSLFVLDSSGAVRAHYDKRALVPFGEYLPLRDLLGRLGLEKLTRGSIDFHPGPGPATLSLAGLPPFSPLICYEVIFSGEVVPPDARPAWLLNVTNDAWFGRSSGPYQHLAMARMRAIEEGLPLVRSANTGVSAIIDPLGRIQAHLPLNTTGTLDGALPQPLPAGTLFARFGMVPFILLLCSWLFAAVAIERGRVSATEKFNKS